MSRKEVATSLMVCANFTLLFALLCYDSPNAVIRYTSSDADEYTWGSGRNVPCTCKRSEVGARSLRGNPRVRFSLLNLSFAFISSSVSCLTSSRQTLVCSGPNQKGQGCPRNQGHGIRGPVRLGWKSQSHVGCCRGRKERATQGNCALG